MANRIKLHLGDITQLQVDVIVNAANQSLLGGGGVDGAIHRAAGPGLLNECRKLGGCETGEAKLTEGYELYAKHVIHTVGPVWQGGDAGEASHLESCYKNTLQIAFRIRAESMAFPSISTGIYGYPIEKATRIAVSTVHHLLQEREFPTITFCCFSKHDFSIYEAELKDFVE